MTGNAKKHLISLSILLIFGLLAIGSTDTDTTVKSSQPEAPDPKKLALADVEIKNFNWHKGGFDSVMLVDVTFLNKGTRAVKDFELTCQHFSNSDTLIDSNSRVIYEIIPAGKTKTIKNFNMGLIHSQAAKTSCKVTDLVLQ